MPRAPEQSLPTNEVNDMPMWAWILLIILLVLLVTGGIGYGRR